MTTTDLAQFGFREKRMAADLLNAMCSQGLPSDFDDDEVTVMMNTHSGNVFLTNSNYDAAMMNGDKLESFYSCPMCGHEGFKENMQHDGNGECMQYLRDIGVLPPEEGTCKHCGATGEVGEECDNCEPQDDLGPMIFQRTEVTA
jgi:hypothetical protein